MQMSQSSVDMRSYRRHIAVHTSASGRRNLAGGQSAVAETSYFMQSATLVNWFNQLVQVWRSTRIMATVAYRTHYWFTSQQVAVKERLMSR